MRGIETISQVFETKADSIVKLKKAYGEDFSIAYLQAWIVAICSYFNVVRPMTEDQIKMTAIMIHEEYYFLNLADLALITRKITRQEFGKVLDRLDASIILTWFEMYVRDRMDLAESMSRSEHDRIKSEEKDTPRMSSMKDNQQRAANIQYIAEKMKL